MNANHWHEKVQTDGSVKMPAGTQPRTMLPGITALTLRALIAPDSRDLYDTP